MLDISRRPPKQVSRDRQAHAVPPTRPSSRERARARDRLSEPIRGDPVTRPAIQVSVISNGASAMAVNET
jgi:hypothetical protein